MSTAIHTRAQSPCWPASIHNSTACACAFANARARATAYALNQESCPC